VFGEEAELYDRARPSYPAALIDELLERCGGGRALDVGAGTGHASAQLAAAGFSGIALEPDPAMAQLAERALAPHPGWRVERSEFEAWDGSGPFELVCSAQAWHWLAPGLRERKAHALLCDGGWLALWGNRPGPDDSPLRQEIDAIYARLAPDVPARGIGAKGNTERIDPPPELGFGEPIERAYPFRFSYTTAGWLELLRTQSDHRMLGADQLERLLSEVAPRRLRAPLRVPHVGGTKDLIRAAHARPTPRRMPVP
jgi:SAM-dependent methyltransferase